MSDKGLDQNKFLMITFIVVVRYDKGYLCNSRRRKSAVIFILVTCVKYELEGGVVE